MSKEIELGGVKVPQSDWDITPESIKLVLLAQREQLKLLNARVVDLEKQQRRNSKNSSQLPSKDEKGSKGTEGKVTKASKKKVFGFNPQKGKKERNLSPPEACHSIQEEVFDLPSIELKVSEHQVEVKSCPHCGQMNQGNFPSTDSTVMHYGPRIKNMVGHAVHDGRKSYQGYGCEHVLCNAHHLRDLQYILEQYAQAWAFQMSLLLVSTYHWLSPSKLRGKAPYPLRIWTPLLRLGIKPS